MTDEEECYGKQQCHGEKGHSNQPNKHWLQQLNEKEDAVGGNLKMEIEIRFFASKTKIKS